MRTQERLDVLEQALAQAVSIMRRVSRELQLRSISEEGKRAVIDRGLADLKLALDMAKDAADSPTIQRGLKRIAINHPVIVALLERRH
jgi:hypothetical protein